MNDRPAGVPRRWAKNLPSPAACRRATARTPDLPAEKRTEATVVVWSGPTNSGAGPMIGGGSVGERASAPSSTVMDRSRGRGTATACFIGRRIERVVSSSARSAGPSPTPRRLRAVPVQAKPTPRPITRTKGVRSTRGARGRGIKSHRPDQGGAFSRANAAHHAFIASAAVAGSSSQCRPSSARPVFFLFAPPHCLKKNATPARAH
jgi:hypothetical protein